MKELHELLAGFVVVANLAAGVWGLVVARQGSAPRAWGHLVAVGQSSILVQGAVGLALLAAGGRPLDPLHARVYGPFMVVAYVVAYGFRTGDVARDTRTFAICGLVVAALGVRAMQTG